MRFFPAEPDIATIFNRILDQDIDLQPDFQRGEVWSIAKQQRLIDSILRGWIVPPILVVAASDGVTQDVLDGQQRLASIREFKLNNLRIDGHIAPHDPFIKQLHGLTYEQLPIEVRRSFDRTTIRIYEVRDYRPEEPAEIFFRLNQPTALTSAEKRNAFFGPVRSQIRDLVEEFSGVSHVNLSLGFGNSRMAYDDVIARFACTLEYGTLHKKVTATAVTDMYRRDSPLSEKNYKRIKNSLRNLSNALDPEHRQDLDFSSRVRLNKATTLSWLLFYSRLSKEIPKATLSKFLFHFETTRSFFSDDTNYRSDYEDADLSSAILVFNDRASARVADVSSVLIRDLVLWLMWYQIFGSVTGTTITLETGFEHFPDFSRHISHLPLDVAENQLLRFIYDVDWGGAI